MSDFIFQSPSTRYTRVPAFDSQSQLQNSGSIPSITDVTNNFFVPQDAQKKRPYSQYQSRSNTQHSILNNTNHKIDDRSPSASNIYKETDVYNAIYSTENYQVINDSNETNIRNFHFHTQQVPAPTMPTTVRTRLHDIYSSPNEDRRASSNRYGLRESLASSPYKSRSLSKTKRVQGSSEHSPRPREKTSGKQRIQKMRDAAEASKSSIAAKKEYKSFTVTTKSGHEIPQKITKDFLSSRSTKTLATPKLKEREVSALATTAPINISASTNVHTVQFTNTSIVSSRKQPGETGQKLRTKRLSNIPVQIDVSNNVEILGATTSNLSAKDSTTKSRKAYINQIYSQILKKHLGGCTPGATVTTTKAGAHKTVEKKTTTTRPATATAKVNTHNLNNDAKRRKENATVMGQTKKETVMTENLNEETRVPVIKQEVLRPKTVAKFKRSDTMVVKRSSTTNLNAESPVASARAQSKEPRANSKEPRANSKEPIQQRRVTANLVQPRTHSVAQISSKANPHSLNNYKFERVLGQGAYAVVKLAMDKIRGEKVAVKIYEKHNLSDPRRMKNVRREISILQSLDHPNIIKLHDSFDTTKQIHMVMEYASKTSLHSFLRLLGSRRLTDNEVKHIVLQIGQGLSYCHGKKIIHRDVKLENILLDEDNNVKIIDFGFSIIASEEHKLNIYCGTPSYMAPEIAGKVQYKGAPTDVWSLGIILFILLCGHFPFKGNDDRELFAKIRKAKYEIPDFVSKGGRSLIKKILKANPDERLKINEILEDSWINERDEEQN